LAEKRDLLARATGVDQHHALLAGLILGGQLGEADRDLRP
jgi:hypothetical protein